MFVDLLHTWIASERGGTEQTRKLSEGGGLGQAAAPGMAGGPGHPRRGGLRRVLPTPVSRAAQVARLIRCIDQYAGGFAVQGERSLRPVSAPTTRSAGTVPMNLNWSTSPTDARMVKFPPALLSVPVVVPLITTETEHSGAPCSSLTPPITVFCCATAGAHTMAIPSGSSRFQFSCEMYRVLVNNALNLLSAAGRWTRGRSRTCRP